MYKGNRIKKMKFLSLLLNGVQGKRVDKYSYSNNHIMLFKNMICLTFLFSVFFGVNDKKELKGYIYNNDILELNNSDLIDSFYKSNLSLIDSYVSQVLRETILIGDSRTLGILSSGVIREENTIYGVGYGYDWFVGNSSYSSSKTNAISGAVNALRLKIQDDKLYDIVIWLGVNDCTYVKPDKYFESYVSLAEEFSNQNFYVVSVGPVYENGNCPRNNTQIDIFNATMKSLIEEAGLSNLKYINLGIDYSFINKYDSVGLHYGMSDYANIYSIIEDRINNEVQKLERK